MNASEKVIARILSSPDAKAEAEKVYAELRAIRGRKRAKRTPTSKEKRNEERKANLEAAVALVKERAGDKCEVCGRSDLRLEVDHLASGGLRRHRESPETLLLVCCDDHRSKHRSDPATLRAYVDACIRLGMKAGLVEMQRRLAKVTPSVPVQIIVREP